jgi:hypothetical protein
MIFGSGGMPVADCYGQSEPWDFLVWQNIVIYPILKPGPIFGGQVNGGPTLTVGLLNARDHRRFVA